jgi:hypothetical protein
MRVSLAVIEEILSVSGIAGAIEQLLPAGVRERQLKARTLLAGMMLTLADGRPAHLTRVLEALTSLPEADQKRLGVIADWKTGPHQLTYRQVEHTARLITRALAKAEPDGAPSPALQQACDALLEASIPGWAKNASSSLAADWTDVESWSRPVPHGSTGSADPEARWGHRNVNLKIQKGEMFFGYYLPAATWASPLRAIGAGLVQDLHPNDRGPRGTHEGAVICNGNLYCPATPGPLLQLAALPPGATPAEVAAHDNQTAELARHKLGLHAADDADGRRRHACPAVTGKIRCPLRPASMTLSRDRPEILAPPQHPPACCTQQTITAGPEVAEKTRQKHDYPSHAWRLSYQRRTAAERLNSTIKDTATTTIARGWIRLTGLTPLMLWLACLMAVRNQRILATWNQRERDKARRATAGLPPGTRKRNRTAHAGAVSAPP